jgi:hypothetical protein
MFARIVSDLEIWTSSVEEIITCTDNLSYTRCSLIMTQRGKTLPAIAFLHLIETSHRLRKIHLYEEEDDPELATRLPFLKYLADHASNLPEIKLKLFTAACVIKTMRLFPNLTSITWECLEDFWIPDLPEHLANIPSCPTIKSFTLSSDFSGFPSQLTTAMIKACPNITSLDCVFPWAAKGLNDVLTSCPCITELTVSAPYDYEPADRVLEPLMLNIAAYGTSLKSLKMVSTDIDLDIRQDATKMDMKTIIRRVKDLELVVDYDCEHGAISSLFEQATDIDLQSLTLRTDEKDAEIIAKVLKGCHNAKRLHFMGSTDISPVMTSVSGTCHLLMDLTLLYPGRILGSKMQSLLQSCPKLESLKLRASIDLLAYESLALYGGNLTSLELLESQASPDSALFDFSSYPRLFPPDSAIIDSSFRQHRKQWMRSLKLGEPIFFSIKHLACFLSRFGKIDKLNVNIPFSIVSMPTRVVDDDELHDMPIFHADEVIIKSDEEEYEPDSEDFLYDHVLYALVKSCQSLKSLTATMNFLKASTLVAIAYMCHHRRQRLVSIKYSAELNLDELKQSLAYIRLHPC